MEGRSYPSLLEFMVVSPTGSTFWKSINTTGHVKTGAYLAEQLIKVIKEVGVSKVVQVVIDSAANCITACSLLQQAFKQIPRTPCATHALNLLLEDIGRLLWAIHVFKTRVQIVQFFKHQEAAHAMIAFDSPNCALLGYSKTRFFSCFYVICSDC